MVISEEAKGFFLVLLSVCLVASVLFLYQPAYEAITLPAIRGMMAYR